MFYEQQHKAALALALWKCVSRGKNKERGKRQQQVALVPSLLSPGCSALPFSLTSTKLTSSNHAMALALMVKVRTRSYAPNPPSHPFLRGSMT